jgi:hypothetical protein
MMNQKLDWLYWAWWLYSKSPWYQPSSMNLLPHAKPYWELLLLLEKLEKKGYLKKSKDKKWKKMSKSLLQKKK